MLRFLLSGLLLLACSLATAEQRLFYQPLNTDSQLSPAQWQEIWGAARSEGVHTLIVQWTAYGDEDFGGSHGWLAEALRAASLQKLQLVLGLAMDPAYFQRQRELDRQGLVSYWKSQLGRSLQQQRQLRDVWQLPVTGWYLPLELDDLQFSAPVSRVALYKQLSSFASQLDAPLHVSAYSTGVLSPTVYANWLAELGTQGLQVWWQDGAGTRNLSTIGRHAYLAALPCQIGIILEAFRQTNQPDAPFRAVPKAPAIANAGCHPAAVFSLRYRPWGQPLLLKSD